MELTDIDVDDIGEKLKKGDKVRLTIDCDYEGLDCDYEDIFVYKEGPTDGGTVYIGAESYGTDGSAVTMQKIEPPVEPFKTGDIVQSKQFGYTYLLRQCLDETKWRYDSLNYEAVSLGLTATFNRGDFDVIGNILDVAKGLANA